MSIHLRGYGRYKSKVCLPPLSITAQHFEENSEGYKSCCCQWSVTYSVRKHFFTLTVCLSAFIGLLNRRYSLLFFREILSIDAQIIILHEHVHMNCPFVKPVKVYSVVYTLEIKLFSASPARCHPQLTNKYFSPVLYV